MDAEQAFKAFDYDLDGILTVKEIQKGLKIKEVYLLDTEWKMLVDAMDSNADGVLTMEEWQ